MKKPAFDYVDRAPSLNAVPFARTTADPEMIQLTDRQREQLARIGMRLNLPPRMTIYREAAPAHWVFAVAEGSVKCFRELPSGKRVVGAFLFPRDLFGLAENGRYLNCAQAITRVVLYRLPLKELRVLLMHDAGLQFQFLSKITHELRQAQRRAILLNRRDAAGRLAMFIDGMAAKPASDPVTTHEDVVLPMTRSDIAAFLGLSLECVSRASAELERRGMVKFTGRHIVRIIDPPRFSKLVAAL
jgi:CRP-like cAMP-binding protein